MKYNYHLGSSAWKRLRNMRVRYDDFKCAICGATVELNVHRLNYDHVGHEILSDVITLCNYCYIKVEAAKRLGVNINQMLKRAEPIKTEEYEYQAIVEKEKT